MNLHVQISWQAQHFVHLHAQMSWQAQYKMRSGEIAKARNAVFFQWNRWLRSWQVKVCGTTVARRSRGHARIILGIVRPLGLEFSLVSRSEDFVAGAALCEPPCADFVAGAALCVPPCADFLAGAALCEPPCADVVVGAALCEPPCADFVAGAALCAPPCADVVAGHNTKCVVER